MARSLSIFVSCIHLAVAALAIGAPVAYGQSFGAPINLSGTADWSGLPQIAASGSNVYVAWTEGASQLGSGEIFFKASNDGGLTFTAPQNLSSNVTDSSWPQIAVSGSNVYVVWQDVVWQGNAVE